MLKLLVATGASVAMLTAATAADLPGSTFQPRFSWPRTAAAAPG